MKAVNYFCAIEGSATLNEFASIFFQALGVSNQMERHSSNYVNDHYFVGSWGSVRITVANSDEEDLDDLPYWVCLECATEQEEELKECDESIKNQAGSNRIRVSRIDNFGKKNMQRINYY